MKCPKNFEIVNDELITVSTTFLSAVHRFLILVRLNEELVGDVVRKYCDDLFLIEMLEYDRLLYGNNQKVSTPRIEKGVVNNNQESKMSNAEMNERLICLYKKLQNEENIPPSEHP